MARWKAVELAPSLVEKARRLWDGIASRRPRASEALPPEQAPAEIRIPALERRIAGLEEEAASSFEVVTSIAQQHSQLTEQNAELVQFVDALLARTRLLSWSCGGLAAAFLALLLYVLMGR
jgi:hypothetical protein